MTDEQIIKALECCNKPIRENNCTECAFYHSGKYSSNMLNATLDLINRQKAEIERLQMDNKQLQSDVIYANQNWDHIKGLWECEKEKVDSAKQKVICACKMLKTAKSEAIKEFAEKLKGRLTGIGRSTIYGNFEYGTIKSYEIDNLVKEMTDVEVNQRKEDEGK